MNIKKSLLLLLTVVIVFSCKQDEILDQNTGVADLTDDISQYDNSNLGLYKGTFTTLDASERGIVEVRILNNVPSIATLTLVSGTSYTFKSQAVSLGENVSNLTFTAATSIAAETSSAISFDFSVDADGSNPGIRNAILGNRTSDILILKETSRGPIALITGTWVCNTDCLPNMVGNNQTFNFAGSGGALTPQITLNSAVYDGSGIQQPSTVQGDFEVAVITGTVQVPQSPGNPDTNIIFEATHRWRTGAPDCSTVNGNWTYESPSQPGVPSAGTMVSDMSGPNCPPLGDSVGGAVPLPYVAPGACEINNTFIELATGGYTASGEASSCANLLNNDIFYTWTATTDALTITGGTGSSGSNPQVTIYSFAGGVLGAEIDCTMGSNLGSVVASGWAVSDPLLVRLSATGNIGVCFEEFTLPPPSANDLCANAIDIDCGDTVMGNTVNDSDDHNSFREAGNDVYYTYTEGPDAQTITVSLCGSSFDTTLHVYDDACGFTSLIVEGDESDACITEGPSQVTFTSEPMTSYTIVVDGYGPGASGTGASGAFTLSVSCDAIPELTCGDSVIDSGGPGANYSVDENIVYNINAGGGMVQPLHLPNLQWKTVGISCSSTMVLQLMRRRF